MKRLILPLAIISLAALSSCAPEEKGFKMEGDPYFNIVVRDIQSSATVTVAELDEMSAQYEMTLGPDAWSASANAKNHVSKALRFCVSTNMRWKVVSATGEDEDWIHPFPDSGEKEGLFFFKTDRHIDPVNEREAMFNILVDSGSGYKPLEGMITITQQASSHFLEMDAAMFNVEADGKTIRLRVTSNVDWDYTLAPMAQYGTSDVSWIEDKSQHSASKQIDTLVFTIAPNGPGIRGADLRINYNLDGEDTSELIPITQYPAGEAELEGFPVKWAVKVADNTFASTWSASGTIPPVSGEGMMTWHNEAGRAADKNGKIVLDLHENSPRASGVWPGDYLEIVAASPVSAGSIIKLVFATRVSGTGQKYWRLEYRDGNEWKIAGKSLTDPTVNGPDGAPVVYTHEMASDGSTNIHVEALATYANTTDQVEFRFICAANWQANGGGPLSAPNGGTWRLSVDEATADNAYQPQISVIAAGSEVLTKANLQVSPAYLVFEDSGTANRKFTVSCDHDFTLTPSQSWIHVNASESGSGSDLSFTVTCDDNEKPGIREGSIVIVSGFTRAEVAVIQGGKSGSTNPGPEPPTPTDPASFPVLWSMPSPSSNVAGTDYSLNNTSGSWVLSDSHEGKLSVIRTSTSDENSKATTYQKRSTDSEPRWNGKHCLLHYGMYKGDYWLFEVFNVKNPAGTYSIEFCMESSGNGPKYFALEYSLNDSPWVIIDPKDGSYSDENFQYTFAIETASVVNTISKSVAAPAITEFSTLKVRARIVSRSRVAGTDMVVNHTATNRIGDHVNISFTAD